MKHSGCGHMHVSHPRLLLAHGDAAPDRAWPHSVNQRARVGPRALSGLKSPLVPTPGEGSLHTGLNDSTDGRFPMIPSSILGLKDGNSSNTSPIYKASLFAPLVLRVMLRRGRYDKPEDCRPREATWLVRVVRAALNPRLPDAQTPPPPFVLHHALLNI